ncbi:MULTISPECIES: DUF397 domain-containing protein [unclassified Nocardiopsis]|uniref:DUF397 domain-containing protein n=1 Tax=unclassified Nocardiopsis TaxID=2649073 RepID=UPI00135AA486|nr:MULTISPECIES: DUF397 domain-containing protein [unclassified Nocardiopsis]
MSDWHKSTYSGGSNECVEIREHSTGADVRDTQNRSRGQLAFTSDAWGAFLGSLTRINSNR